MISTNQHVVNRLICILCINLLSNQHASTQVIAIYGKQRSDVSYFVGLQYRFIQCTRCYTFRCRQSIVWSMFFNFTAEILCTFFGNTLPTVCALSLLWDYFWKGTTAKRKQHQQLKKVSFIITRNIFNRNTEAIWSKVYDVDELSKWTWHNEPKSLAF